jgi:isoamylase
VDGFRFDEGSIMSRGEDGAPMAHPPVVWNIELSEELADTKIIAEAWDAAGLYQIGYFPGYRWAEWNGRYRDDIRRFVKGDPGMVGAVAARMSGSADIYETTGHEPINSINFITCHDGFTLNDVVSYDSKHNDANGEGNRDGINDNLSWNCGAEGETDNPDIDRLRTRQVKNFAAILLLSQGVPMILGGDEMRRTQGGNNNAYCQNNELSWYDWTLAEKRRDVLEFFRKMIAFRKRYPTIHRGRFFCDEKMESGLPDVAWHSCQLFKPEWYDGSSRVLACTLGGLDGDPDFHIMLNMFWEGLEFELPPVPGKTWTRVIDTSLPSPEDVVEPERAPVVAGEKYHVDGRSVVVLASVPLKRLG